MKDWQQPPARKRSLARWQRARKCTGTVRTSRPSAARPARSGGTKDQVSHHPGRCRDQADQCQAAYGSEGWGFESLRARFVMSQDIGNP
jgi:hypothetical protein